MNKENIKWNALYALVLLICGIVIGYIFYNSNLCARKQIDESTKAEDVISTEKSIKESLARDLIKEFEVEMNNGWNGSGIEMDVEYNGKAYTTLEDFNKDYPEEN